MFLAVINESTAITQADVAKAVQACADQLKMDVAPAWNMIPPPIVIFEDKEEIPDDADILTILDKSDRSGHVGYHRVTPAGRPYLRVFVHPILIHGGELLTGSLSVSTVMSHEICEWFVDRFLNLWVDGPDGQYALEICDPVAEDTYEIDGVSVSNFVYRLFFVSQAPLTGQFDHLSRVKAPFTARPGCQMHVRKNGTLQSVRGGFVPDWKFSLAESIRHRFGRRQTHHG
jgi:hypothetical protein